MRVASVAQKCQYMTTGREQRKLMMVLVLARYVHEKGQCLVQFLFLSRFFSVSLTVFDPFQNYITHQFPTNFQVSITEKRKQF